MLFLQQFNFKFEYKPGCTHRNAGAMSRISCSVAVIHEWSGNVDLLHKEQNTDSKLSPIIKALMNHKTLPANTAPGLCKTFIHEGILYCQFRQSSTSPTEVQLAIPDSMKDTVLYQLHNQADHMGISKTTAKVKTHFYWPGYEQDIQDWISLCEQCQKRNPPQPTPKAPLGTIKANHPFEKLSWDIMGYPHHLKDTNIYWS